MNDLIDGILKKKRDNQAQGRDFKKEKQENEALQKKAERKQERLAENDRRKQEESKDSYLTIEQHDFIYHRINQARKSLKD